MLRNKSLTLLICVLFLFIGTHYSSLLLAQNSTQSSNETATESLRLDKVVDALEKKQAARDRLKKLIVEGSVAAVDVQSELDELSVDIQALNETFELLTVGDIENSLFNVEKDVPFDWSAELMLVLEPVLDTLQSLTEKPRQMTDLRATIALNKQRLVAAENAIASVVKLPHADYEDDTRLQIKQIESKWRDQKESTEQRLTSAEAQLERLQRIDDAATSGLLPSVKEFMLGRGLTLLLAVISVVVTWLIMRILWWLFSNRITNKQQRRGSLWFRLLSYSFYLVNILFCIIAVLAVLYAREDLLLLAITILLLTVTAMGIRRYIPAYVREARLLLDLGSVREGERVMYEGLPWQVNSVNLHSVLWNPALEGIVRLPLETVQTLTSRPFKDKNWFPSQKGDFVLLPDATFGTVLSQTPELVQLRIRGGMIQWFRTADFYAMNIINLSSGQTFGVGVTFGFDYGLQAISLTEIPKKLRQSVSSALAEDGFSEFVESVLVELKSASASSIDYLVFVSVKSEKASDYFHLERLIQQTCVAVANECDWNIPFPQMMVHYQAANNAKSQTGISND